MTKIGLLSDTHGFIDERVYKHFDDCDEIWHGGDIGTNEVASRLSSWKPLRAVHGNIDDKNIQILFPENLIFVVEGIKIYITHIGGKPDKYPLRVKEILKRECPKIFICGHSHVLMVKSDPKYNNMIFINPGAAGNQGFHRIKTIMKFDISGTKIENMKVIELGVRGIVDD